MILPRAAYGQRGTSTLGDIGPIFDAMSGGHAYRGQQFSYGDAWRDFFAVSLMPGEQAAGFASRERNGTIWPLNGPRMGCKNGRDSDLF